MILDDLLNELAGGQVRPVRPAAIDAIAEDSAEDSAEVDGVVEPLPELTPDEIKILEARWLWREWFPNKERNKWEGQ